MATTLGPAGNINNTSGLTGSVNYLGNNNANIILGHTSVASNDTLSGFDGNDTLNGGLGADLLKGGLGSDVYEIDLVGSGSGVTLLVKTNDSVIEVLNGGVDTVVLKGSASLTKASTITLAANLEILDATQTGSTLLSLSGNGLNNSILGNSANNLIKGLVGDDSLFGFDGDDALDGGTGIDSLVGGLGNDTYIVDIINSGTVSNVILNPQDIITEINGTSDGIDTLKLRGTLASTNTTLISLSDNLAALENLDVSLTTTTKLNLVGNDANNVLIGNAANNIISGGIGNDTLDGRAGKDTMVGGIGDDTYVVDAIGNVSTGLGGDVITELADEGDDTVITKFTATLSSAQFTHIENLSLLAGTKALNGSGNANANTITGNDGINILDGGLGVDKLIGGKGNDTYVVDNEEDNIIETLTIAQGGGVDLVKSSVDFTLSAYVENLTLTDGTPSGGIVALNGSGNELNNTITGNAGNNSLDGGAGNDVLKGGLGNDTLYDAAGVDTLFGGAGDDTYLVNLKPFIPGSSFSLAEDVISEVANGGIDTLILRGSSFGYQLNANIEHLDLSQLTSNQFWTYGNALNNDIKGLSNFANNFDGGAGNDTLHGGAERDYLIGGLGADLLIGGNNSDYYEIDNVGDQIIDDGGSGFDRIVGKINIDLNNYINIEEVELKYYAGNLNATGNSFSNVLSGNDGNNKLDGGAGNDILYGNYGNDTMTGSLGADTLLGGAGLDTFDFNAVDESGFGSNRDVIFNFSHALKNKLDFSTIDANILLDGNQAFTFIGAEAFDNAAGQLRYVGGNVMGSYNNGFFTEVSTGGTLSGDIDGDGNADFEIVMIGINALEVSDFIL